MDFKAVANRAVEVRAKYAKLERARDGKSWTTTQVMQGFIGDVGDLMKLVMAKDGARHTDDLDNKLAHELSDRLWCVLVLADQYGIDLQASFMATMDELEARIEANL